MKFGQLRHPVTIQRRVLGKTDGGEPIEQWLPEVDTFAQVSPLRGQEYFSAEAEQSDTTHRVIMRARPTNRPKPHESRVVLRDGRELEVEAVLDKDERNEMWELMCREATP